MVWQVIGFPDLLLLHAFVKIPLSSLQLLPQEPWRGRVKRKLIKTVLLSSSYSPDWGRVPDQSLKCISVHAVWISIIHLV